MNKLIRNTLILGSLWVLLILIGLFFIYGLQKKTLSKLRIEEREKTERLSDLRILKDDLSELQDYYTRLQNISLKYTGTLASFESPGETFDYIRRELKKTRSSVKLSMDFVSEESFKSVIKRKYDLRGSGKFVDIYNLLWFLENGPVFYSIESITVDRVDEESAENPNINPDEASFNLSMVGYDRSEGPKINEINRDFGAPKNIADLFKNRIVFKYNKPKPTRTQFATRTSPTTQPAQVIKKTKPVNANGLPEINSNCEILALTPYSVVIKDERGKIIKLRKGDEIFGGNLAELKTQSGEAIFKFNGGYGNKLFVLTVKN